MANLFPPSNQILTPGQPIVLDIHPSKEQSSSLPLCLLINARSLYNKGNNIRQMLQQLGPEICIITETFESEKRRLSSIFKNETFQYISYFRKNRSPGGGCAIVFNDKRLSVTDLEIAAKSEIETCWALVVPKSETKTKTKVVRRLAVGAYYRVFF